MSKRERKKGKRNKQKVLWERERNTEKAKKYIRKEKETSNDDFEGNGRS